MISGNVEQTFSSPRRISGWMNLAAALAVGLGLRLAFVHLYGQTTGDSLVYGDIAKNLLLHGVYGLTNTDGSVRLTLIRLPGYPLFLAACFRIFGMEHYTAVMIVQCLADLATCILAAATAARILGRRAGLCALWLGLLCPFTINYVAAPLTETLSLLCIALAFYALARWQREPALNASFWMMGVALAYAILLRPDSGLLAVAVVPAAAWIAWTRTSHERAKSIKLTLALCVVVGLPLIPWAARNWRAFHVVQPLAPRYATDPTELIPHGFNHWYRSWAIDFASTVDVFWNLNGSTISIDDVPTRAFDTDAQYDETAKLLSDYNNTTTMTKELDDRFQHIADERIAANPLRYYVALPAARLADMILRPRTEMMAVNSAWWRRGTHPAARWLCWGYAGLNLFYIVIAAVGAWFACTRLPRSQRVVIYAMLAYVAMRSALLLTLDNSEQRYTLELFPIFFVLGAAALSSRWRETHSPR
jgi:4-amino-4-deoxy-L-arabinose transferase-like glycosyltransferase